MRFTMSTPGALTFASCVQDLVAQFTDSANAAGQLHDQADGEVSNATAQIVGSAESAITTAVHTANNIWNQVIDTYCTVR